MKLNLVLLGLSLIAALAVPSSSAAVHNLGATIDCTQEVPNSCGTTSATGAATVTYDDVSSLLSWNITFSGTTGPLTGMHFHGPAGPGVNAGVQVNVGAISGLTSPSVGNTTITALQGADLLADFWYLNLHTAALPGGEIRGNVGVGVPVELLDFQIE